MRKQPDQVLLREQQKLGKLIHTIEKLKEEKRNSPVKVEPKTLVFSPLKQAFQSSLMSLSSNGQSQSNFADHGSITHPPFSFASVSTPKKSQTMKPTSDELIQLEKSRKLAAKRISIATQRTKEESEFRIQQEKSSNTQSRLKWLDNLKKHRESTLSNKIDIFLLKSILKDHPDTVFEILQSNHSGFGSIPVSSSQRELEKELLAELTKHEQKNRQGLSHPTPRQPPSRSSPLDVSLSDPVFGSLEGYEQEEVEELYSAIRRLELEFKAQREQIDRPSLALSVPSLLLPDSLPITHSFYSKLTTGNHISLPSPLPLPLLPSASPSPSNPINSSEMSSSLLPQSLPPSPSASFSLETVFSASHEEKEKEKGATQSLPPAPSSIPSPESDPILSPPPPPMGVSENPYTLLHQQIQSRLSSLSSPLSPSLTTSSSSSSSTLSSSDPTVSTLTASRPSSVLIPSSFSPPQTLPLTLALTVPTSSHKPWDPPSHRLHLLPRDSRSRSLSSVSGPDRVDFEKEGMRERVGDPSSLALGFDPSGLLSRYISKSRPQSRGNDYLDPLSSTDFDPSGLVPSSLSPPGLAASAGLGTGPPSQGLVGAGSHYQSPPVLALEEKGEIKLLNGFVTSELLPFIADFDSPTSAAATNFTPLTLSKLSTYFSKLVSSVVVVGPSEQELKSLLAMPNPKSSRNRKGDPTSRSPTRLPPPLPNPITGRAAPRIVYPHFSSLVQPNHPTKLYPEAVPDTQTTRKLEPKILYISNVENEEYKEHLHKFCFPGDIDVEVGFVSLPEEDSGKLASGAGSGPGSGSEPVGTGKFNHSVELAQFQLMQKRRRFVHVLADHTRNQFVCCLIVPKTFRGERGALVTTEIGLCFLSRFPFIEFFFQIMDQFVSNQGLELSKPIPIHSDENILVDPELKFLHELAEKLSKMYVPLLNSTASMRVEHLSSTSSSGTGIKKNRIAFSLNKHSPIDFQVNTRQLRLKLDFSFPRPQFQDFFTQAVLEQQLPIPSTPLPLNPSQSNSRRPSMVNSAVAASTGSTPSSPPVHVLYKLGEPTACYEQLTEFDNESTFHTLLWSLPILLKHLPIDQIVFAVGCAVLEFHVQVQSKDPLKKSACLLALWKLLSPLRWSYPIIVSMPPEFAPLEESPVPVFLGLDELPPGFKEPREGVILITTDKHGPQGPRDGIVHMNTSDVINSHHLKFPNSSKLEAALREPANIILKITAEIEKEKEKELEKEKQILLEERGGWGWFNDLKLSSTNPESFSFDLLQEGVWRHKTFKIEMDKVHCFDEEGVMTYVINIPLSRVTVLRPEEVQDNRPYPFCIENNREKFIINASSADSRKIFMDFWSTSPSPSSSISQPVSKISAKYRQKLLAAVSDFSRIMTTHILTVVNTTLQLVWEDKHQKKQEKKQQLITLRRSTSMNGSDMGLITPVRRTSLSKIPINGQFSSLPQNDLKLANRPGEFRSIFTSHFSTKEMGRALDSFSSKRASVGNLLTLPSTSLSPNRVGNAISAGPSLSHVDEQVNYFNQRTNTTPSICSELTDVDQFNGDLVSGDETMGTSDSDSTICSVYGLQPMKWSELKESESSYHKKILDCQAFVNYCQFQNQHKKSRTDKNSQIFEMGSQLLLNSQQISEGSDEGKSLPDDNLPEDDALPPPEPIPPLVSRIDKMMEDQDESDADLQDLNPDPDAEPPQDALTLLFQISLSRTLPLPKARLEALRAAYELDDLRAASSSYRDGVSFTKLQQKRHEELDRRRAHKLSLSNLKENSQNLGIIWCNGRCEGRANTPFCTNICLLLWEERIQLLKHQMNIRDIIHRQQHSNLVLNTKLKVIVPTDGSDFSPIKAVAIDSKGEEMTHSDFIAKGFDSKPSSGKVQLEVKLKPRPEMKRHKYETQSQFQRRVEEKTLKGESNIKISHRDREKILHGHLPAHSSPDSKAQKKRRPEKGDIFAPICTANRNVVRLYANEKSSPAVRLIAAHYVKKQKKNLLSRIQWSLRVLKPFLLYCVDKLRRIHVFCYVTSIQRFIRGYLTRKNLSSISDELKIYRMRRNKILSIIKVKIWLRCQLNKLRHRIQTRKESETIRVPKQKRSNFNFPTVSDPPPISLSHEPKPSLSLSLDLESSAFSPRTPQASKSARIGKPFASQSSSSLLSKTPKSSTPHSTSAILIGTKKTKPSSSSAIDISIHAPRSYSARYQNLLRNSPDRSPHSSSIHQEPSSQKVLPSQSPLPIPIPLPSSHPSVSPRSSPEPFPSASSGRLDREDVVVVSRHSSSNSSIQSLSLSHQEDRLSQAKRLHSENVSKQLRQHQKDRESISSIGSGSNKFSSSISVKSFSSVGSRTDHQIHSLLNDIEKGSIREEEEGEEEQDAELQSLDQLSLDPIGGMDGEGEDDIDDDASSSELSLLTAQNLNKQREREISSMRRSFFPFSGRNEGPSDPPSENTSNNISPPSPVTSFPLPSEISLPVAQPVSSYPSPPIEFMPTGGTESRTGTGGPPIPITSSPPQPLAPPSQPPNPPPLDTEQSLSSNNQPFSFSSSSTSKLFPSLSIDDDDVTPPDSTHGGDRSDRRRSHSSSLTPTALSTRPSSASFSLKLSDSDLTQFFGGHQAWLVKCLGPSAADSITSQQSSVLYSMWELLQSGVEVLKHGRSGKPKTRYLFCDEPFTKLYWRAQKQGKKEEPKARRSSLGGMFDFKKLDEARELHFREIIDVRSDASTEVMQRAEMKGYLHGHGQGGQIGHRASISSSSPLMSGLGTTNNMISILLSNRTLDYEISDIHWPCIFNALKILVRFFKENPSSPSLQPQALSRQTSISSLSLGPTTPASVISSSSVSSSSTR